MKNILLTFSFLISGLSVAQIEAADSKKTIDPHLVDQFCSDMVGEIIELTKNLTFEPLKETDPAKEALETLSWSNNRNKLLKDLVAADEVCLVRTRALHLQHGLNPNDLAKSQAYIKNADSFIIPSIIDIAKQYQSLDGTAKLFKAHNSVIRDIKKQ